MNNVQPLNPEENHVVDKLIEDAKKWAKKHKVAIGVTEIALGSAALAYGVNTGCIEIGTHIVATTLDKTGLTVGITGAGIGAIAGSILGGIGVASGGVAIGIPAVLVVGGAAWVLGATGYTVGDAIFKLLNPIDWGQFGLGCSLLTVGTALVLDGIRRIMPESVKKSIKYAASAFVNGVLMFGQCVTKVIAESLSVLTDLYQKAYKKIMDLAKDKAVQRTTAGVIVLGGTGAGAALGSAAAASTVTVLGSHTLGAAALGLGLVSTPIWPVIALAGGGAVISIGLIIACQQLWDYFFPSPENDLLKDLTI